MAGETDQLEDNGQATKHSDLSDSPQINRHNILVIECDERLPAIYSVPLAEWLKRPARRRYRVKQVLPHDGTGVLFGESGSAKSFFALDLGMHVARGEPWRSHRVHEAGVVYLCAEGIAGFTDRLRAYLAFYELKADDLRFEVIAKPLDLLNGDLDEVILAIQDANERIGPIGLIVIDTLNRTMPGGDENTSEAMTAYLRNVARLAEAVGAFALIVHHPGKDPTRGARGHSSLKAAVDIEIEIQKLDSGEYVATITKARDFEAGARYAFALKLIELGRDDDGDPMTSCVVIPTETPSLEPRRREPALSGVARVVLQALKESVAEYGEAIPGTSTIPHGVRAVQIERWRARFVLRYGAEGSGTERKTSTVTKGFNRGKEALLKRGLVAISDPWAWLPT